MELPVCVPVGEALALRPDARVDDPDDDVLPRPRGVFVAGCLAAELIPKTALVAQAEEGRRVRCVGGLQLVARDREHFLPALELRRLALSKPRGEAVVRVDVVVELLSAADRGEHVRVPGLEVVGVLLDIARCWIDLLAFARLRRRNPSDAAVVGDDGVQPKLDDVAADRIRVSARCGTGSKDGRQRREPDDHGDSRQRREAACRTHRSRRCFHVISPLEKDSGQSPSLCRRYEHGRPTLGAGETVTDMSDK
jgi:hypothetical protein